MDVHVRQALATDRVIDITTTGRTSGLPRRIETWLYRVGDSIYLTGSPGRRDWNANLLAIPDFVFHLKGRVSVDLLARARPVTNAAERREILVPILRDLGQSGDLERWLSSSPLVEVRWVGPSKGDVG